MNGKRLTHCIIDLDQLASFREWNVLGRQRLEEHGAQLYLLSIWLLLLLWFLFLGILKVFLWGRGHSAHPRFFLQDQGVKGSRVTPL